MRRLITATLCGLALLGHYPVGHCAAAANPEDQDIPDPSIPAQPAAPATPTTPATPDAPTVPTTPPAQPAPSVPIAPAITPGVTNPVPATPGAANGDMIMVPRTEWEQMKRDIEALKHNQGQAAPTAPTTPTTPGLPPTETPAPVEGETGTGSETANTQPATGGNKGLLLPDISFIGQAKGLFGTDRRAENLNTLRLSEGELGIQSYVYPNVKADAFITAAPSENTPFQVEETYLTFIGVRPGLSVKVGRQHTPFGRTGLLHTHSWLYTRQLLPFNNLVDSESLAGDGVDFSYLVPTKGSTFIHADLGLWHGLGPSIVASDLIHAPFGTGVPNGTGAGYTGSFQTGRLWLGHPLNSDSDSELELGTSYARGHAGVQDAAGTFNSEGILTLNGLDASYRHFMSGGKRLLLRSEYFQYTPHAGLITNRTNGYYGLLNYRYNPLNDIGLLLENSGFPQLAGAREKDISLILTRQFTEQFFGRLQATHGSRPGKGGFNELRFQLTWGVGPHTHNLE